MARASGTEAEDDYPFSLAAPLAFDAGPEGFVTFAGEPHSEGGHILLTATERNPNAILLALGDYGAILIEPNSEGSAYRFRDFPSRDFQGLDPGGVWPTPDGFLIQLFRSPLASDNAPYSGSRLFTFSDVGLQALSPAGLASSAGLSEELFALFPDSRRPGAWLAQLRSSEAGDSVTSRFLALESLRGSSVPLEREAFETILRPRPLASLGDRAGSGLSSELGAAISRIGGEDFILRLRSPAGEESYWARGSAEQARTLEAWAGRAGSLILESGGRAVYLAAGQAPGRELRLMPPLPDAIFGSVAFLPLPEGILVTVTWESSEARASGLLVFRL